MAFPLTSIGAAASLGSVALPGALHAGHTPAKGLNFAGKLALRQAWHDKPAQDESSLLSQIAGLLQNGTPMATIVDRLAKQLADALAGATGNADANDSKTRSTLQRALAGALAPPGTSPPLSNGELAKALEQRLKNLLTTLTSEPATAGQQSEFSGQVLDANSARETPAQQKSPTSTDASADEVNAFAQALLQKVATGTAAPATPQTRGVPDVLTRILARAANADAQRGARVAASSATSTTVKTTASSNAASPSALFERLIAIIAEHGGNQSDANADKQFAQDFASNQNATGMVPAAHQTQSNVPSAPAFATQIASASTPAAPAQSAAHAYSAADPHAIIEQVIKGITMRDSGTTSEVRMRLQPEHLGDVALKLTVSGNTITANVIAQNAHVRDLLLSNQQQLARSLSEAGLSLGNFSVDVSGGNAGFTQQQAQQQRASVRPGAFDAALATEQLQWSDPRFGPPLLPAGKSLVLNYLV